MGKGWGNSVHGIGDCTSSLPISGEYLMLLFKKILTLQKSQLYFVIFNEHVLTHSITVNILHFFERIWKYETVV